jgi:hypothetical protein
VLNASPLVWLPRMRAGESLREVDLRRLNSVRTELAQPLRRHTPYCTLH